MNSPSYFEIQADDTRRAMDFYGRLFGWSFERMDGAPVEYWRIETEEGIGGLLKRPGKMPPPEYGTNAYICSMQVQDFDSSAQKATELGAQVAMSKFPVAGICWQGYFLDTEGNLFGIFQPDPAAK